MTSLTMSDIHALVTSGVWTFIDFQQAMHLTYEDAVIQYNAIVGVGQ